MKYVFAFLILLAVMFQSLPLRAREIFNTEPFDCSRENELQRLTWISQGYAVVRKSQAWLGMDGGTVADFAVAVMRERDRNFILPRVNWDHYAEPGGINGQLVEVNLAPDYILLRPGDTLTLHYRCHSFGEVLGRGHVIVYLWSFP